MWKSSNGPDVLDKYKFHEGGEIHNSEGGNANNRWSTQTSHKFKKNKKYIFSFVDVIFFTHSAYIVMYGSKLIKMRRVDM